LLPFVDAIRDVEFSTGSIVSIETGDHMSVLGKNAPQIGKIVSDWFEVIEKNTSTSTFGKTNKYDEYLDSFKSYSYIATCNKAQRLLENRIKDRTGKTVVHYSLTKDITLTLLSSVYPELKMFIHHLYLFPSFIMSAPTNTSITSYTPFKNMFDIYSSFNFQQKITNKEQIVKLTRTEDNLISAKQINKSIFREALFSLPKELQEKYFQYGKQIYFGEDINIPLTIGCSVVWLLTPISIKYMENQLIVRSPTLKTPLGTSKYDSRMNTKLFSKAQALEWILFKSYV
jgi:hypothetical protein